MIRRSPFSGQRTSEVLDRGADTEPSPLASTESEQKLHRAHSTEAWRDVADRAGSVRESALQVVVRQRLEVDERTRAEGIAADAQSER